MDDWEGTEVEELGRIGLKSKRQEEEVRGRVARGREGSMDCIDG